MLGRTANGLFNRECDHDEIRGVQRCHIRRPSDDQAWLDEIDLRLDSSVRFAPGDGAALPGRWGSQNLLSIEIGGKADSRETIQSLRESLLPLGTLTSSGADTERDFSLRLITDARLPDSVGEGE